MLKLMLRPYRHSIKCPKKHIAPDDGMVLSPVLVFSFLLCPPPCPACRATDRDQLRWLLRAGPRRGSVLQPRPRRGSRKANPIHLSPPFKSLNPLCDAPGKVSICRLRGRPYSSLPQPPPPVPPPQPENIGRFFSFIQIPERSLLSRGCFSKLYPPHTL